MVDNFDEPDNLVQSSFVIPCSNVKQDNGKGKGRAIVDDEDDIFTILSEYEQDQRCAKWREAGYEQSLVHLRSAFERCKEVLYQPLIDRIDKIIQSQSDPVQYYLPGPSRLTTLAIHGMPLSNGMADNLKDSLIRKQANLRWVYLHPRECLDLATTLRIITARTFDSNLNDPNPDKYDLSDPISLLAFGDNQKDNKICLFIDNLAFFHYGILNDLLQAVHSISQTKGAPQFTILLFSQLGQVTLDDKLDPDTLPILDLCKFTLSPSTYGFEKAIEEYYSNVNEETSCTIWMGEKVLESARRQFYEGCPNLDRMQATFELALHHHFTQNPLSAIAFSEKDVQTSAWKPTFFIRLRDAILQNYGDNESIKTIRLPLPHLESSSKQEYLRLLLEDDQYLIKSLNALPLAVKESRNSFVSGVRLTHLLREIVGMNGATQNKLDVDESNQKLLFEPRKQTVGGLLFALLNKQQMKSTIQDLRIAIRSRSLNDLENLLDRVRQSGILNSTTYKEAFESLYRQIKGITSKEDLAISDSANAIKTGLDEEERKRLDEVQKNLLREESSSSLKREAGDWILTTIRNLLNSSIPLQNEVWTYNLTGYLNSISDPSPRMNILAALHDPKAYLDNDYTTNNIPDICRAYRTYQDAGRMINLADWFNAFRSSIKEGFSSGGMESKERNGKRHKRKRSNSNSSDLSSVESVENSPFIARTAKETIPENLKKEIANWNQADSVQLRFALAVHEMGKMGFLKRTGRKPEHVLKLIHDLPPRKS